MTMLLLLAFFWTLKAPGPGQGASLALSWAQAYLTASSHMANSVSNVVGQRHDPSSRVWRGSVFPLTDFL
jgi:hypothetical protein